MINVHLSKLFADFVRTAVLPLQCRFILNFVFAIFEFLASFY